MRLGSVDLCGHRPDDSQGKVSVTSKFPQGNSGYPAQPAEIDHFMKMLNSSANTITPEELKTIETALLRRGPEALERRRQMSRSRGPRRRRQSMASGRGFILQ